MSIGEVTVSHRGPVSASPHIGIDLGGVSGEVLLIVEYINDRYRRVRMRWKDPRRREVAGGGWVWLANAILDTDNGELLDASTTDEALRARPRKFNVAPVAK